MNHPRIAVNAATLHALRRVLIEALRIIEDVLSLPDERRATKRTRVVE